MNIAILGGGSWGVALASHFINNHQVKIWEFFPEVALEMQTKRTSPFLKNIIVPENVFVSSDMKEVIDNSDIVLFVTPSDKVEVTLKNAQQYIDSQPLIICSKGFASDNRLLSVAIYELTQNPVYFLYGPTIAEEVFNIQFTGMTLAGPILNQDLADQLSDSSLVINVSDDVIGVQIGASVKNILAIIIGMIDGMQMAENAKAFFITYGLAEITKLGLAFGANEKTFYGLTGIGDIITTCFSEKSRNRTFGFGIGQGKGKDELLAETKNVVEGLKALEILHELVTIRNIELPLLDGLYEVIYNNLSREEYVNRVSQSI